MGWKNWSYWLRGAVIGLILILMLILVDKIIFLKTACIGCESSLFSKSIPVFNILYIILNPVTGALIGWIYGKIKQKK